jgi:hypothetical protein
LGQETGQAGEKVKQVLLDWFGAYPGELSLTEISKTSALNCRSVGNFLRGCGMSNKLSPDDKKRDEIFRKMLNTPAEASSTQTEAEQERRGKRWFRSGYVSGAFRRCSNSPAYLECQSMFVRLSS